MSSAAVFAPDGSVRMIPQANLSDALDSGGESAVQMRAPDGSTRYVRQSQVDAARQAGGTMLAPSESDLDQLRQQSMRQAQQVGTSSIQPAVQNARKWQAVASMPLSPPIIPGQQIANDVKQGNYSRAAHEAITGVAKAYSPLAIPAAITPSTILPFLAGIGGGAAVGKGAKSVAGYLGANPDRANLIGDIGGVAGGIGSGMAANAAQDALTGASSDISNWLASHLRDPATARQSEIGKPGNIRPILPQFLQKYTIPDWIIPKGEAGTPTNPGWFGQIPTKVSPPEINAPLGTPENPGWMAKLPVTMPKQIEAPDIEPELGTPENPGPMSKIPNRLTRAQIESLGEQKAAAVPKATVPGVNIVPEPRTPFDEEVPNYMASVPRSDLSKLAKAGKPGAGKQLQQLGKTVIYVPPTGYPGPRTKLPWEP